MRLLVATFNVGGLDIMPIEQVAALLDFALNADLVALSLQECSSPVVDQITEFLSGYSVVNVTELKHRAEDLMATRLVVCSRSGLDVSVIGSDTVKTLNGGIGSRNKGGVMLHLRVGASTDLVFLGAHLAAHRKYYSQRLMDLQEVIDLSPASASAVFLFGDLNFRLGFLDKSESSIMTEVCLEEAVERDFVKSRDHHESEGHTVRSMLSAKQYSELVEQHDQLREAMRSYDGLRGFSEGSVDFAPTFKYASPSEFDPKRLPAYCDRVLFKASIPLKILWQKSLHTVTCSDHRPVAASFEIQI